MIDTGDVCLDNLLQIVRNDLDYILNDESWLYFISKILDENLTS